MSKGKYLRKKTPGGKILRTVICVLAVLVLGVGIGSGIYVNGMLNGVNHVAVPAMAYQNTDETEAPAEQPAETVGANAATEAAVATEAAAATEAVMAAKGGTASKPEDFQNYLIVCKPVKKDGTVKVTDTMIVCTLNKATKNMTLTSLMADALVEVPQYKKYGGGQATLNTVYGLGATYGGGTAGSMELMNLTLYKNFGIEIDKNFELDLQVLARVVSRLKSVKIDLAEEEAKYLTEATGKTVEAGKQSMDGNLAKEYIAMWADEDAEGISAISGQKKLFEAIVDKVRTQYVSDLENIVKDTMPSITTSMTYMEFREFLISLLPMVRKMVIENGGTCPVDYQATVMDVNGDGTEEEVFTFDVAQTTKTMRAITKGEK